MGLIIHDKVEQITESAYLEIYNKYMELLYAVERKFPNETRHETALRYIQEAERVPAETEKENILNKE